LPDDAQIERERFQTAIELRFSAFNQSRSDFVVSFGGEKMMVEMRSRNNRSLRKQAIDSFIEVAFLPLNSDCLRERCGEFRLAVPAPNLATDMLDWDVNMTPTSGTSS
jgi:hypothetical protein